MTTADAVQDLAVALLALDRHEMNCGLPILSEQDKTWDEWVCELQLRLNYIEVFGPSQGVLDVLGALVVAMKLRLASQEEVSVTSGEAA